MALTFSLSMITASISLIEILQREFLHSHSRQLPDIYKVITRTYSRGIQMPLEQVLNMLNTMVTTDGSASKEWLVAPKDSHVRMAPIMIVIDVLERMLCDTYALCGYTYERATEGRVRRACVEWLGEIARQQLATLQYCHALGMPRRLYYEECESWRTTATQWYGLAAREAPDDGRWYAALAELAERDGLQCMYYHCKSVLVVHPCLETRELMHEYVSRGVHRTGLGADATPREMFVHLMGQMLTGNEPESFDGTLRRMAELLSQEPCPMLETEWGMLALCMAAAILEFGRENAWIDACKLAAFHLPSNARPLSDVSIPMLEHLNERMEPLMQPQSTPTNDVPGVLASCEALGMPRPLSHAVVLLLTFTEKAVHHLQQSLTHSAAHINAPGMFLTIMMSFLYVLTLRMDEPHIHVLCQLLAERLPWSALAAYACGDVFGSQQCDAQTTLALAHTDLPEDWCLRGVLWNVCTPRISSTRPPNEGMLAFEFTSESNMLADLGAISRHFSTLATNAYRAAYAQDPELKRLLQARHARASILIMRFHHQIAHFHASSFSGNSLSS